MHGVPVAIKDQFLTKGILTTAGSNMLRDYIPEEDATVVTRLKEAGAVINGKTNLTEFAITTNHFYPHGMMYNPWDMGHFAGSSSGGSASATAAFCAPRRWAKTRAVPSAALRPRAVWRAFAAPTAW